MSNTKTINLDQMPSVKCACGNETFHAITFIKRVPGLMVGQTTDLLQPVPAYECVRCRRLLDFGELLTGESQKKPNPITNFLSNF